MKHEELSESLRQAAGLLMIAKSIVVLTGAGVSKESGIPTFRDALTGLWANYSPEKLATIEGFLRDPPLVWQWYDARRQTISTVEPNAGHCALADLEKLVPKLAVVTQNVDGLHKLAGSKTVIELHGNISRVKCFDNDHEASNTPLGLKEPPRCHCGSLLRPAVVWFGEMLPENELRQAFRLSEQCDVMMVVGTSGLVHPAASMPLIAKRHGATVIEVNPEKTPISDIAEIQLSGPSAKILPHLVKDLQAAMGNSRR
jgi:NAD-dependent deacetylase